MTWAQPRKNMLRVTAAVEATRRDHKHLVIKSAGLTVGLMWRISRRHAFAKPGRARELQLEFAFGTALSVALKILLRYDDLARCLWDPDYCNVFHTHVRFYVEGRKTRRMGALYRALRGRRTTTRTEFTLLACAPRITSARATCYRTSTTARARPATRAP
jgi:hypothetical protein